jgi:Pyruvate/2-oxoacid:ferredoxin oxidoreductase gamma subunit
MIEIQINMQDEHRNKATAHLLLLAAQQAQLFGRVYSNGQNPAMAVSIVQLNQQPIVVEQPRRSTHFVIMADDSLFNNPQFWTHLPPNTRILVNSTQKSADLRAKYPHDIISFPAEGLANMILGHNLPDTALLAAFVALTQCFPNNMLEQVLRLRFKGLILERHLTMMAEAIKIVQPHGQWAVDANNLNKLSE